MATSNDKTREPETPDQAEKNTVSLSASVFAKFKEILDKSNSAREKIDEARQTMTPNSLSLKAMVTAISNIFSKSNSNQNPIPNDTINTLAGGITPEKAAEMFAQDIAKDEAEVRRILKTNGVDIVPQNVFDGLVSFQNQIGNITYAYIKGEKIDLTGLYRQRNWIRVASLIAADERDRPRRIQEAAMIAAGSYGTPVNMNRVIDRGYEKTDELIAKERLNQETGDPATAQQLVAAANAYWNAKGEALPSLDLTFTNIVVNENISNEIKKQQPGPFPY